MSGWYHYYCSVCYVFKAFQRLQQDQWQFNCQQISCKVTLSFCCSIIISSSFKIPYASYSKLFQKYLLLRELSFFSIDSRAKI